jgi:hypothetical protein
LEKVECVLFERVVPFWGDVAVAVFLSETGVHALGCGRQVVEVAVGVPGNKDGAIGEAFFD